MGMQKGVPETEGLPSAISGAGLLAFVIITVMLSYGTGFSTLWSAGKTGKSLNGKERIIHLPSFSWIMSVKNIPP
jgi:hypothetical protein